VRVLVLADDLTGASDTVVSFARSGWSSLLSLSGGWRERPAEEAVALSLDTRRDPDAAALTGRAAHDLAGDRLYLKIDSTMRGRVAEQVAGALAGRRRTRPGSFAVLCPAYPAMGRTVEQGHALVAGVPIHRGPAGRDPVTPVPESDLRRLVPGAVSVAADEPLAGTIRDAGRDHDVVVVDARDQSDLERLARAIVEVGPDAVPVGSAGLASALAEVWRDPAAPYGVPSPVPAGTRTLVVVSSLHEVARTQVAELRDRVEAGELAADLLVSPEDREGRTAHQVAHELAAEAARVLAAGDHDALALVGGDGAAATLTALAATGIRVLDAPVEGVPVGVLVGGAHDGLTVATKAGGFGGPQTLNQLIRALSAEGAPR